MRHLQKIFDELNLSRENGLHFTSEDTWENIFPNRVEKLLRKTIEPDAFFCFDNKPFILFFQDLNDKKQKLKEIWNFNESPIVIIIDSGSLEIYNGFKYVVNEEALELLGTEEILTDFDYFKLVTGTTWEKYRFDQVRNHRIDFKLLSNIQSARNVLVSGKDKLSDDLANSLLGKAIFVRYLIDRNVRLDFKELGESRCLTNEEFCQILSDKSLAKQFFYYLENKFNGDLFKITSKEFQSLTNEKFSVVINLLLGNEISTGQLSLFNLYDFSIIPIEFVSNIYELFIGEANQNSQGAYYTPLFLVEYILAETVEQKLNKDSRGSNCRVLDPACGSGIFLVETLRKIIEQFLENNQEVKENPEKFKTELSNLVLNNIFGVDKDKSAINVAIFSIYITLLDYQKPSDIETFKFPPLLNKNFFVSDFFDIEHHFNTVFRRIDFDFILGNPPWKGGAIGNLGKKYLSLRKKNEKDLNKEYEVEINNGELAEAFIIRTSDFAESKTKIALIIRSQILYNAGYKKTYSSFRNYLLQEFFIDKIFELAPVRKKVFINATAPACILFFRYAFLKDTSKNKVNHISLKQSRFYNLFRIFTIQRNDYKVVLQSDLKKFDWLWKVLVFGNYLDFNFIKRLKSSYEPIQEVISDESKFIYGTGVQYSNDEKENAEHLIGKPFIDTEGVKTFFLDENKISKFDKPTVHRRRDPRLYLPPLLLIREGLNMKKFTTKSVVSEREIIFKDSIGVIKAFDFNQTDTLRSISGLYNSDFSTYFAINTFPSIGIERERAKNYSKFSFPFFYSKLASSAVKSIEDILKVRLREIGFEEELNLDNEILKFQKIIDDEIQSYFGFSEIEKDLIDYAKNISIPLIKQGAIFDSIVKPLNYESEDLNNYVNLFLDRFNPVYKRTNQKVSAEIIYNRNVICVFFKLIDLDSNVEGINWIESKNDVILKVLFKLGIERITDKLFIQKDIRGFENDGFFIIKPNEKKLWHKAIAHLDLLEFVDAILTSGKKKAVHVQ